MGKILKPARKYQGLESLIYNFINQNLRTDADVTFKNLTINNDLTVNGNMSIDNMSIVNTNIQNLTVSEDINTKNIDISGKLYLNGSETSFISDATINTENYTNINNVTIKMKKYENINGTYSIWASFECNVTSSNTLSSFDIKLPEIINSTFFYNANGRYDNNDPIYGIVCNETLGTDTVTVSFISSSDETKEHLINCNFVYE